MSRLLAWLVPIRPFGLREVHPLTRLIGQRATIATTNGRRTLVVMGEVVALDQVSGVLTEVEVRVPSVKTGALYRDGKRVVSP